MVAGEKKSVKAVDGEKKKKEGRRKATIFIGIEFGIAASAFGFLAMTRSLFGIASPVNTCKGWLKTLCSSQ